MAVLFRIPLASSHAVNAEVGKVRSERFEEFKQRQTDSARAARDKELATVFTPNLTDQKVLETAAAAKEFKALSG